MSNYSPKPGSAGRLGSNSTYDAFSILASPSSSKPVSRSLTPSNPPRPTAGGTQNASDASDAFSSLLGSSFSTSNNQDNLSLAARRAAAQKEVEAKAARDRQVKQTETAAWNGLDLLGQGSSNTTAANTGTNSSSTHFDDDWLFDKPKPAASGSKLTTSSAPTDLVDDWGLSDFASQSRPPTKAQSRPPTQEATSLFDALDDDDLIPDSFGRSAPPPQPAQHSVEAEDDILGALSKPVASKPPSPPKSVTPPPAQEQPSSNKTSSPPPHVIGQIVEMGFTPQQARLALASTDTGLDVQQALETLLSNGVGTEQEEETISDRPRRGLADFRDEDEWEDRARESPVTHHPVQRQSPLSTAPSRTQKQPQSLITPEIQERADKLLAQASEIGLNVFSRANALWKDGKEKVQKAYEERAAKNRPVNDGRPRWMADVSGGPDQQTQRGKPPRGRDTHSQFRDDDDVREELPPLEDLQQSRSSTANRPLQVAVERMANILDEESAVYVSPARRRPAPSRTTSQPTPSVASIPNSAPWKPQSPPLRTRQAVSATDSAIASSNAHKVTGTELYKLGQFANAEQSYSAAIDVLPENHLLLVPLYNNRAVSRTKIGEYAGAIEDCTTALAIIGPDYHPAREAKITREEEGASVDLADAYIKALRRRAEAYEGREKWDLALKDWEAIIGCEWSARMRSDASTGASRCRKMLSPEKEPSSMRTTPVPRPIVRPTSSNNGQDFEAVKKLRLANQAQEQEEQAKASLKDAVDARLQAWKGGKETNIRALVASLETVLWPELGWQKVGLHELVSPGQVKVRYMKAIAKLHPDKINSSNTTVEQRMIANGVFAALNDAWTAFKQ